MGSSPSTSQNWTNVPDEFDASNYVFRPAWRADSPEKIEGPVGRPPVDVLGGETSPEA